MKAHSILTTLFPRLGINRYCISDIYQICNLPGGGSKSALAPYSCRVHNTGNEKIVTIPSFLPSFVIGANHEKFTAKRVHCHLFYRELPEDSLILKETGNPAVAYVKLHTKGGSNNVYAFPGSSVEDPGSGYRKLWEICSDPLVTELHFTIDVCISQKYCESTQVEESSDDFERLQNLAAKRRVLLAGELTTGYRRYISIILMLLKAFADASKHQSLSLGRDEISPICGMKGPRKFLSVKVASDFC